MKKLSPELTKEKLLDYYYENKELIVPIFSVVVSVLLFLVFIIPQLVSFPSRKTEVDIETAKLDQLKESEKVLTTLSTETINAQVQTAARVLPETKQFEEILNTISTAANLANVQIESYSFRETEVSSKEQLPFVAFDINVFGELDQAVNFINQLYKTKPISEVKTLTNSDGISEINVIFYYAPFTNLTLDDRTAVRSMSPKERAALNEINQWDDAFGGVFNLIPEGTGSAETASSPF